MEGKVHHAGSGWAVSRVRLAEGGGASREPLPPAFRLSVLAVWGWTARERGSSARKVGRAPGAASVAQSSPLRSRRRSSSSEVWRVRLRPGQRRRAEPSFVVVNNSEQYVVSSRLVSDDFAKNVFFRCEAQEMLPVQGHTDIAE